MDIADVVYYRIMKIIIVFIRINAFYRSVTTNCTDNLRPRPEIISEPRPMVLSIGPEPIADAREHLHRLCLQGYIGNVPDHCFIERSAFLTIACSSLIMSLSIGSA